MSFHIPPHNRFTVCPPGRLRMYRERAKNIVVATLPRSGTHLMIDLILNNFSRYKKTPLYVDIDHFLDDSDQINRLVNAGGYVVKTHYPASPDFLDDSPVKAENMEKVLASSVVINVARPADQVIASIDLMWSSLCVEQYRAHMDHFVRYWQNRCQLNVNFSEIIDRAGVDRVLTSLSWLLDMEPDRNRKYPLHKSANKKVLFCKLLTRCLGCKAPYVNTTIGFSKKQVG